MADEQARGARGEDRDRRSDRSWRGRRRRRRRERELKAQARDRRKRDRSAREAAAKKAAKRAARAPVQAIDVEPSASEVSGESHESSRTERRLIEKQQTKRARRSTTAKIAGIAAFVVVAAGAGVGIRLATSNDDAAPDGQAVIDDSLPDGVDAQPALLLVTASEDADPRVADSIVILAHDRRTDASTILLIPTSTVTDVPGHGVLPLADALRFGGPALVAATVDNLLGIHVDGVADMTYRDWAGLFSRVGIVELDIPERLVSRNEDGTGDVRFLAGRQQVTPEQSAELLAFEVDGERELDRLPRIQQVLLAHLKAMAADPNVLSSVVGDGVPMIDTEMARPELSALLTFLANASTQERLDVRVLPVRPIGAAGEDGYRPDELRLEALVNDRFAASIPSGTREGRSLQVLNGNGLPGIGQSVAEQLVPEGFRVVLTGNADDFDHEKTRIVIYDDSPEQIEIANQIRELLGVGVVEISRTPQSVVDVTIVVGRDYPPS